MFSESSRRMSSCSLRGRKNLTDRKYRSRSSIASPFNHSVQGRIDALPLRQQLFQDHFAVGGEPVKPFVALLFFAPFAEQQPLALQAPQQRVQRAFVNCHALFLERLTQRVAVLFPAQGREDSEHERAPTQLQPQVFKHFVVVCTGRHIVYATQYKLSSTFFNLFLRGGNRRLPSVLP